MEYTGTYGTDAVVCYSPFKTRSAKRFFIILETYVFWLYLYLQKKLRNC